MRARNLKPGFFRNEDLAECTPMARLLFAGLWLIADREGRLEDRPKRIKGELFPFDAIEVEPLLGELERFGFIQRYEAGGMRCIVVVNFLKHQNPHHREGPSQLPPCLESPGLEPDAKPAMPEAAATSEAASAAGMPPAGPGLSTQELDLARGSSRAESLFSDSLITDPGMPARKRASAPPLPPLQRPDDVAEQVWRDWLQLRKAKKAAVTPTVLDGAKAEAAKAGMTLEGFLRIWCMRGSQGLQADWIKPHERQAQRLVGVEQRDYTGATDGIPS